MSGPEQSAARAWRSFLRAKAETRRAIYGEVRARGLRGPQLEILRILASAGEAGVKLNEISQQLCVTGGNTTGLVDRLEEAGLLARVAHPEDRRITLARLTPAGRATFEELHPLYLARVEQLMSVLNEAEQTVLADLLERIAEQAAKLQ